MIAKKAAIGREWRRVRRGEHQVACAVDERAFFYGVRPPKNENKILTFGGEVRDNLVRKLLPAVVLV